MQFDDIDEKEPLTMGEFLLLMLVCFLIFVIGSMIGSFLRSLF